MKQLQELAGIPSRATVRLILKGNGRVKATESLTYRLFELIRKSELEEDKIVKKLYGNNRTPSYGPYRTLKTRLRNILAQAVLLDEAENPSYGTYNEAYEHGYRQLSVARILISHRAYTAAREIARHTYNQIKHYEIVSINYGLTDLIASLYLGVGYDEGKFNEYNKLSEFYSEAAGDLAKLKHLTRRIRDGIYAHRKTSFEVGEIAGGFFKECSYMIDKYPAISLIQSLLSDLEVNGCMLRGEYREAINASDRGIKRLNNCFGVSAINMSLLAINGVECTLHLRDFQLGIRQIEKAKKIIPVKSINGIKLLELSIRLGLETGEYRYAYLQLASLDRKALNRLITSRHVEYWRILEAHVHFLVAANEIEVRDEDPKLPKFRLNRFLNNVPTYSRNKKGMNVQILILQVLFLIVGKKYSLAIDRVEALERYCSRYLRKNENFRNNCFFKLLLCAINSNFNRAATLRKADSIYKKMISVDSAKSDKGLEWIPYEELWDILVKNLVLNRKMVVSR